MHAKLLRKKADNSPYELSDNSVLAEYENVFEDTEDFESKIKATPDQLDAYKLALEKEKESIELYKKMLEEATSDDAKELFKFLIKEEEAHYSIFEEIRRHLSYAEE